ncbi:MAG: hypothetical protein Q6363_003475 [Candidatus Njordarchaeota archaeon]
MGWGLVVPESAAFVSAFYGVALSPLIAILLHRNFDPMEVISGLRLMEYKLWINIFMLIPLAILSSFNWFVLEQYLSFMIEFTFAFVGQLLGTLALSIFIVTINFAKMNKNVVFLWPITIILMFITGAFYLFPIIILPFLGGWIPFILYASMGVLFGFFSNVLMDFLGDYVDFIFSIKKYLSVS